ncbi:MAG: hypothetical protein R3211_05075 [Balneolaceae bacterium]|nr:hypothetical protein [Balneolaceae bacterium]
MLKPKELNSIPILVAADSLKPVYYAESEGYTTDPPASANLEGYGCKGDFNSDSVTDYALVVRNTRLNMDQLVADVSGYDSLFTLDTFTSLKEQAEKAPYSRILNPPRCYKRSKSGRFIGIYEQEYEMPGDMIRFGWYSYLWNTENRGFKQIITSD